MKILIIKTGALGDVVRCTFLAQALKDRYRKRHPEIYWLTSQIAKPLFINNPYINHLLLESEGTLRHLRNINFDLVINLEESAKFCNLSSSLNAKKINGFYMENNEIIPSNLAKEWFNMSALGLKPKNDLLKLKNKKTHNQIMSEIVGVTPEKYHPFLRLTNKQRQITSNFMRRYNLSRSDLIIGINTGAADRWPKALSIKKTIQLIEKLATKLNAKILLFGGTNEIERNKEIIRLSKVPIIDTGCGNDLFEFPAVVNACNILITTDSLGLHIALALKRKTICLVGPTSSSEIGMYGLGEKVVADSKCVCCYKSNCNSMEKIKVEKIISSVKKIIDKKITLLITSFKEPKTIGKAVESAINQKTNHSYDILVSAPDKETLDVVKKYQNKHKNLRIFKDPGKGKSYALNLIFKNLETDILILTDGDVYLSDNIIEDMTNLFLDPEIGCATGRPIPIETRKIKYGYWANFLFDSAHKLRQEAFNNNNFLECSGYLFAFRKKEINKIPLDVAEDTLIPYIFWEKGYRIGYAPEAKVYVKNVNSWKEWINQKVRTSKAHETLGKYVDIRTTPRVKTFKTEARGITWLFSYPRSIKEHYWSFLLVLSRAYMWFLVYLDTMLRKKHYKDAWVRSESTK